MARARISAILLVGFLLCAPLVAAAAPAVKQPYTLSIFATAMNG
jgi:hypothetical protein